MKAPNRTFLFVNLLFLVIALFIIAQSLRFDDDGRLVPMVVAIPTLIMIMAAVVFFFMPAPRRLQGRESKRADGGLGAVAPWPRAAVVLGWLAALFVSIFLVGFYPSVALYTLGFVKIEGKVSWFKAALMAAALWGAIYVSFDLLMGQRLFEGIFFGALLPAL